MLTDIWCVVWWSEYGNIALVMFLVIYIIDGIICTNNKLIWGITLYCFLFCMYGVVCNTHFTVYIEDSNIVLITVYYLDNWLNMIPPWYVTMECASKTPTDLTY